MNNGVGKKEITKLQKVVVVILFIPITIAMFLFALGVMVAALGFLRWALSTV